MEIILTIILLIYAANVMAVISSFGLFYHKNKLDLTKSFLIPFRIFYLIHKKKLNNDNSIIYAKFDEDGNVRGDYDFEQKILRLRESNELVLFTKDEVVKLRDFLNQLKIK